jgi:hypothetical protein
VPPSFAIVNIIMIIIIMQLFFKTKEPRDSWFTLFEIENIGILSVFNHLRETMREYSVNTTFNGPMPQVGEVLVFSYGRLGATRHTIDLSQV